MEWIDPRIGRRHFWFAFGLGFIAGASTVAFLCVVVEALL